MSKDKTTNVKLDFPEAIYSLLGNVDNLVVNITNLTIHDFVEREILPRVTSIFTDKLMANITKQMEERVNNAIKGFKEMLSREFIDFNRTSKIYNKSALKETVEQEIHDSVRREACAYYTEKSTSDLEVIKKEIIDLYNSEHKRMVEETLKEYITTKVKETYKKEVIANILASLEKGDL